MNSFIALFEGNGFMLNRKSKEVFSLHYNSFRFDNLFSKSAQTSIVSVVSHIHESDASHDAKNMSSINWNGFSVRKICVLLTSLFMFFTATSLVSVICFPSYSFSSKTILQLLYLSLLKGILYTEAHPGENVEVFISPTALR